MFGINEEEKRDFSSPSYVSLDVDNNKNEEIEKSIREFLISSGYTIDENGNIYSPKDSIKDGVLGFIVGDALGVPVEFASREMLKKYPLTEMVGYGRYDVPEGTWSDDSSMVLATMDSIIENGLINYDDIMLKFYEWMSSAKYTATDKLFDIGYTTQNALMRFKQGTIALKCGSNGLNENGNGSLMRMLPIVYYLYNGNYSEEEEVSIINNISSLTHSHEISCLGCKIYYDYLKQILNGMDKFNALNNIRKIDYLKYYSYDSISKYNRILKSDISKLSIDQINSSGYVVDTLEASIWCTLTSNDYRDAVIKAVNLGKDTDTIGAITGSINGIIYGKDSIPLKWIEKIEKRGYIDDLIKEFSDTINNSYDNSFARK